MNKQPENLEHRTRYLLGVTGSMACGKTYVCNRLKEIAAHYKIPLHYTNIDEIRRDILSLNPNYLAVRQELSDRLTNSDLKNPDTSIDRKALGDIIFYDSDAMQAFQEIVYPAISQYLDNYLEDKKGLVLLEWALLVEDNLFPLVDYNVLLVHCSYQTQLDRLKDSDLPKDQIVKRINAQLSNQEKEDQIRAAQQQAKSGDLYLFDTTDNPGDRGVRELLGEFGVLI